MTREIVQSNLGGSEAGLERMAARGHTPTLEDITPRRSGINQAGAGAERRC